MPEKIHIVDLVLSCSIHDLTPDGKLGPLVHLHRKTIVVSMRSLSEPTDKENGVAKGVPRRNRQPLAKATAADRSVFPGLLEGPWKADRLVHAKAVVIVFISWYIGTGF